MPETSIPSNVGRCNGLFSFSSKLCTSHVILDETKAYWPPSLTACAKTFISVWNTLSILHRIEKRNMPEERGPNEMDKPKTEYLIS